MGRGDQRSKKGKIASGSYGKTRPHKVKAVVPIAKAKPVKEKKVAEVATDEAAPVKKTKKTTKKTKEATAE